MNKVLDIRQAMPEMETQIADFFHALAEAGEDALFQPHPFTPEQASHIARYQGKDFYAFAFHEGAIIGYGMLRGWDEGYAIPSLGISIHPEYRGAGIGLLFMHYLHAVATLRASKKVRLRVSVNNKKARCLYEKLGYKFEEDDGDYLLGYLQIKQLKP